MARHVYISCDGNERDLPFVRDVCLFLQRHGCVIAFAPQPEWSFYPLIEEAIERCDAFVVVAAAGYEASTWLAHEVTYAYTLSRWRMGRQVPRLCGLRIEGFVLKPFLQALPIEWLEPGHHEPLLEDMPGEMP